MAHDPRPGEPRAPERRAPEQRAPEQRAADHAAIERLADDLVPALIAKLAASGLGEIEVAEDAWTVRVRRPTDGAAGLNRRSTDRASRAQPGHAGHGHAPGGFEGHRTARDGRPATAAQPSTNGSSPTAADPATQRPAPNPVSHRAVATSPAVGVFLPRADMTPGTRVRSGDRLGAVDMLGIPQEVVAPADGIIGASLVESGQAVEYGQDLIVIELAARTSERPAERSEA